MKKHHEHYRVLPMSISLRSVSLPVMYVETNCPEIFLAAQHFDFQSSGCVEQGAQLRENFNITITRYSDSYWISCSFSRKTIVSCVRNEQTLWITVGTNYDEQFTISSVIASTSCYTATAAVVALNIASSILCSSWTVKTVRLLTWNALEIREYLLAENTIRYSSPQGRIYMKRTVNIYASVLATIPQNGRHSSVTHFVDNSNDVELVLHAESIGLETETLQHRIIDWCVYCKTRFIWCREREQ